MSVLIVVRWVTVLVSNDTIILDGSTAQVRAGETRTASNGGCGGGVVIVADKRRKGEMSKPGGDSVLD